MKNSLTQLVIQMPPTIITLLPKVYLSYHRILIPLRWREGGWDWLVFTQAPPIREQKGSSLGMRVVFRGTRMWRARCMGVGEIFESGDWGVGTFFSMVIWGKGYVTVKYSFRAQNLFKLHYC